MDEPLFALGSMYYVIYLSNFADENRPPAELLVTCFFLSTKFGNLNRVKIFKMKKYFAEKHALTVMVSLFCLLMTIIAATKQSVWEAVAFALAFSFSVENLCHRVKENK